MTLKVRRVVTGHNDKGKAVVLIDEISTQIVSGRPGQAGAVIWTTDTHPVNNSDSVDTSTRPVGTSIATGTVFRIVKYDPGVAPRNHRTDSIDYAVVISGEIDMELDDESVHLKAGDVLVQRGTIHNWVNRGKEPCIIAFSLIGAAPVMVGGGRLNEIG